MSNIYIYIAPAVFITVSKPWEEFKIYVNELCTEMHCSKCIDYLFIVYTLVRRLDD